MAYLVTRSQQQMAAIGHSGIAHVPFLLSRAFDYLDEANLFLRERALGEWHVNSRQSDASEYAVVKRLGENSAKAYGNDLKNFFSYLEVKKADWRSIDYQWLLDRYDTDMARGRWRSRGSRPLAASTVNRRLRTAVEFLMWGTEKGLRGKFNVPQSRSKRRQSGSWRAFNNSVDGRVGIHRIHPKRLRLPTKEEIDLWLGEVRSRYGLARYMACKFILQTGSRLEETSLLRASQLPHPDFVHIDRPAKMDICFGTKGRRDPSDLSLTGKERTLKFNRTFLVECHNYKQLGRAKSLLRFDEINKGAPRPTILLLDEKTGKPLSKQTIYRAWHNCKTLPFKGWSPHGGRHAFSCNTLLRLLNDEVRLTGKLLTDLPRTHVLTRAESLVAMYLTPILGHIDERTSELYLEWIGDHLWMPEHRLAWSNYLEEEEF